MLHARSRHTHHGGGHALRNYLRIYSPRASSTASASRRRFFMSVSCFFTCTLTHCSSFALRLIPTPLSLRQSAHNGDTRKNRPLFYSTVPSRPVLQLSRQCPNSAQTLFSFHYQSLGNPSGRTLQTDRYQSFVVRTHSRLPSFSINSNTAATTASRRVGLMPILMPISFL